MGMLMSTAISIIKAAYKNGCTDNAAINNEIIASTFGTKKLFAPEILDPIIQNVHIENNKATIKRSLSEIIKFLPSIVRVDEISKDNGPIGNTLSILNVSASKAINALIPPPIIKVNKRCSLRKKRKIDRTNGIPIQIIGALTLFLLLLVE
jgi:hypothetical protein